MLAGSVLPGCAGAGWCGIDIAAHPRLALGLLVVAAVLVDAGAIGDQTFGRRAINMLDPDKRSRLNGLFVGVFFVGGGVGALAAGVAWALSGWAGVCAICLVMAAMSLAGDLLAYCRSSR